jgi:hypothetical protein
MTLTPLPPEPPPPLDVFDFGVIAFSSREITIPAMNSVNVGGEYHRALRMGGTVIRQAGFVGGRVGAAHNPIPDDECQDGSWLNLISENGEFWANVVRIDASLYFDSNQEMMTVHDGESTPRVASVEAFSILGGLRHHYWLPTGRNALEDYCCCHGNDFFAWGDTINLSWDIDLISRQQGYCNNNEEYIFDRPGGGIHCFGFQLFNICQDNDLVMTVNWTDVTIYVRCIATYNDHVARVAEITGRTPSANVAGRVREA